MLTTDGNILLQASYIEGTTQHCTEGGFQWSLQNSSRLLDLAAEELSAHMTAEIQKQAVPQDEIYFRAYAVCGTDSIFGQWQTLRLNQQDEDGIPDIQEKTVAQSPDVFTITGMKLEALPQRKGLYIINGRKVLIE